MLAYLPNTHSARVLEEPHRPYGRPVGVVVDGAGALLVADDTGNTVWRVSSNLSNGKPTNPR